MAVRVEQRRGGASWTAEVPAMVRHLDFVLLAAVAGLIVYGLSVLGSVSRNDVPGEPDYYVVRQNVNVALGVIALLVLSFMNPERFKAMRRPFYGFLLVTLVARARPRRRRRAARAAGSTSASSSSSRPSSARC